MRQFALSIHCEYLSYLGAVKTTTIAIVCALALTNCATINTDKSKSTVERNGLSAQNLEKDQCGAFFWSKSEPKNFVFFHQEGTVRAKFFYDNMEHELDLVPSSLSARETVFRHMFVERNITHEYRFDKPVRVNSSYGKPKNQNSNADKETDLIIQTIRLMGRMPSADGGIDEMQKQFDLSSGLTDGFTIAQAGLRIKTGDGWEINMPLYGVYACQK